MRALRGVCSQPPRGREHSRARLPHLRSKKAGTPGVLPAGQKPGREGVCALRIAEAPHRASCAGGELGEKGAGFRRQTADFAVANAGAMC